MADTTCKSYLESAILHTVGGTERVYRHPATAAQLVDEQRFLFFKLPPKSKITSARMFGADLDSHATPTITAFAAITDGTTIKELCGTAGSPLTTFQAGGVANIDQQPAIGYVIPDSSWYAYVHLKDAPATAAAGDLGLMVGYTSVLDNSA